MKEATRLVVGATQTERSAIKKRRGIRTYCLNDRDARLGGLKRWGSMTEQLEVVSSNSFVECDVDTFRGCELTFNSTVTATE